MSLVKLNLASMSALEKVEFAWRVNDALLAHAATFPDPPVGAEDFVDDINALQGDLSSLDDARSNVRILTSSVADKTKVLEDDLRKLANYVQSISAGNAATIELAGMSVRNNGGGRVGMLPSPEGVNALAGRNPGTVVLRWRVVKHAATYVVQRRDGMEMPFDFNDTETSTRARLDVSGLTSATRYWFRVAANGAAGLSNWTNPVSVVTQ